MKKFKLIKKYPGLLEWIEAGMIAEYDEDSDSYRVENENKIHSIYTDDIENWPEFWEEIEEPLFVTEDGVKIFEGDVFWYIDESNQIILIGHAYAYHGKNRNYVYCSSKDFAEKWIEENKPVYSKKQILDALKLYNSGAVYWDNFYNEIKKELGL